MSVLSDALVEIDLRIEGEAKVELQPGHGVVTATLRRSIHAASGDYNWRGDDLKPSPASPERGGRELKPALAGKKLLGAVGSGLVYALAVHQGHGSFPGYHYLTNAYQKVKALALGIVHKHARRRRA